MKRNEAYRQIVREYPNLDVKFKNIKDDTEALLLIIPAKNIYLAIDEDRTWLDIKRFIENSLHDDECPVCFEACSANTICSACGSKICMSCYISLLMAGDGVFKCPFCRSCLGEKNNDFADAINDMFEALNLIKS